MQTFNSAHIKAPFTLVRFCFTMAFYNENDQRLHCVSETISDMYR